jgi:hypothetical protein
MNFTVKLQLNPNLFKEWIKYSIVDEYQLPQVEGSPVMG